MNALAEGMAGLSAGGADGANGMRAVEQFEEEVSETVMRAVADNLAVDSTILEINSLKLAYDKAPADCCTSILDTLVSVVLSGSEVESEVCLFGGGSVTGSLAKTANAVLRT